MKGVMSNAARHEQMSLALKQGFPMLQKHGHFHDGIMQIACFGPSLMQTFPEIEFNLPLMSVSGAHDFLIYRGWVPTYHVEIDPRPHKPEMLQNPQKTVEYLMASCCHPDFWDVLKGKKVTLWHLINGNDYETVEWVKRNHPAGEGSLIGGDSTVGQRAMNVAAALGYRKFKIFGMDGSFTDSCHAGNHTGPAQPIRRVAFHQRKFTTSPHLLQSVFEMERFLTSMDVEVEFYGDGLMQEMARAIHRKVD
jgi:hypothetical protein